METSQVILEQASPRIKCRNEPLHLMMVGIAATAAIIASIEAVQRGMGPRRDPFWSGFLSGGIRPPRTVFPFPMTAVHFPLLPAWARKFRCLGLRPLALAGVVFITLCLGTLIVYLNHPRATECNAACFQT